MRNFRIGTRIKYLINYQIQLKTNIGWASECYQLFSAFLNVSHNGCAILRRAVMKSTEQSRETLKILRGQRCIIADVNYMAIWIFFFDFLCVYTPWGILGLDMSSFISLMSAINKWVDCGKIYSIQCPQRSVLMVEIVYANIFCDLQFCVNLFLHGDWRD